MKHIKVNLKELGSVLGKAIASGAKVKVHVKNDRKGVSRYLRSCQKKVKYGRQETALRAIADMSSKGVVGLEAYECQFCSKWHIGHPNPLAKFVEMFGGAKGDHGSHS